jgi:hypothetical protein
MVSMATTAADLTAAQLNHRVTVAAPDGESWKLSGRLWGVEHTTDPDFDDGPGTRHTQLKLGLGTASVVLGVDPDHPVEVLEHMTSPPEM